MTARQIRPIRIEGNLAFITLTQGYEAAIDVEDVPLVDGVNWYAIIQKRADGSVRAVYAIRSERHNGKYLKVYLHRVVAKTPGGLETDHIDGDGLNNRRENLRHATTTQNNRNKRMAAGKASGVKGVSWHKAAGKWHAQITLNKKKRHLGLFEDIYDAAAAYAKASAELHGEFGRLE